MKRCNLIRAAILTLPALVLPSCTGMMLGVDDDYGIGSGYYDDYYFPGSPSLFAPAPPPPAGYYYPGFRYPAWNYPRPLPPVRPGSGEPPRPPQTGGSVNRPPQPEQKPTVPSTPGVRPGATGSITRPSAGNSSSNQGSQIQRPTGGASGRH